MCVQYLLAGPGKAPLDVCSPRRSRNPQTTDWRDDGTDRTVGVWKYHFEIRGQTRDPQQVTATKSVPDLTDSITQSEPFHHECAQPPAASADTPTACPAEPSFAAGSATYITTTGPSVNTLSVWAVTLMIRTVAKYPVVDRHVVNLYILRPKPPWVTDCTQTSCLLLPMQRHLARATVHECVVCIIVVLVTFVKLHFQFTCTE